MINRTFHERLASPKGRVVVHFALGREGQGVRTRHEQTTACAAAASASAPADRDATPSQARQERRGEASNFLMGRTFLDIDMQARRRPAWHGLTMAGLHLYPDLVWMAKVRGGFGILDEINMARNEALQALHLYLISN